MAVSTPSPVAPAPHDAGDLTSLLPTKLARARPHLAQRAVLRVGGVVGRRDPVEGELGVAEPVLYCAHGAFLQPAFSEQTQRRHTELASGYGVLDVLWIALAGAAAFGVNWRPKPKPKEEE